MASSKRVVFFARLSSTLALWAVALYIILSGFEVGFFFLIGSLSLLGLWEYFQMLDHARLPNFKLTGMLGAAVLLGGGFYYFSTVGPAHSYDFEMAVMLALVLVVITRQIFEKTRDRDPLQTIAFTLFGIIYVVWLFSFLTKIVYIVPRSAEGAVQGHFYVLYLITVTKFSDMGAYVIGSIIGKHPLIPHVSPNKTWEGFFGALVFATAGSFGLSWLLGDRLPGMTWYHAVVLGLMLGFVAIIGDLAESIIKRSTGVKDSGKFLPGIGGALDLIDSLLFTGPLLFFYMRLIMRVS